MSLGGPPIYPGGIGGPIFPSTGGMIITHPDALQRRAARWHAARFPGAVRSDVAMKAAAELGELMDAVIEEDCANSATGKQGDGILGEAADVLIALLVLTGRWGEGGLLDAAAAKLTVLETPGAHKSSLPEGK